MKILSKKEANYPADLDPIKKNHYYYFDFNYGKVEIGEELLSGNASLLHVKKTRFFTDGNTRVKFKKRFGNKLCTNVNLKGLYYIPVAP
ncbi:MAG: hypothetical protein ACK5IJ_06690 [Mangrovibacterium sp.]